MVCNPNGGRQGKLQSPNVFALVIYVPDPLGQFLDDLRLELVPKCNPHAHVSVLPPRSLTVSWQVASEHAKALAEGWAPFDVELTDIQVFSKTDVIYIEVGAGTEELRGMHSAMNTGVLAFDEPFSYYPHITLAQDIAHGSVEQKTERARRRWREYAGPRVFRAERAVFVQNHRDDCWIDLAGYSLGTLAVR